MVKSLKMKMLYVATGSLLTASTSSAKFYVNSMCTMKSSSNKVIEGDSNKDNKFPLASISKVVTSLWAIEKLGPNYRFATKIHVNKIATGRYDIHIEGSRDPIFGRNAGYFLISELHKAGLNKSQIENLTFDENFLVDWFLEENPGSDTPYFKDLQAQVESVQAHIKKYFATSINTTSYNQLRADAAKINVTMEAKPAITIGRIAFQPKKFFTKPAGTTTLVYKSAPLRTILKRMNNQSNNYIADHLYWNLGGTAAFNEYIKTSLAVGTDELEFYLGSGNNADYILNPNKDIYNQGTCEAMIKVLYKLDKSLEKQGYNLSDVMAVAGKDLKSTVGGYGGVMTGATIAKTGSVNKAKTLAGTVSTKNGQIYFTVLMHTDGRVDWGGASGTIKNKVMKLINANGGPNAINYKPLLPLPFDANSVLQVERTTTLAKK